MINSCDCLQTAAATNACAPATTARTLCFRSAKHTHPSKPCDIIIIKSPVQSLLWHSTITATLVPYDSGRRRQHSSILPASIMIAVIPGLNKTANHQPAATCSTPPPIRGKTQPHGRRLTHVQHVQSVQLLSAAWQAPELLTCSPAELKPQDTPMWDQMMHGLTSNTTCSTSSACVSQPWLLYSLQQQHIAFATMVCCSVFMCAINPCFECQCYRSTAKCTSLPAARTGRCMPSLPAWLSRAPPSTTANSMHGIAPILQAIVRSASHWLAATSAARSTSLHE